jgi:hypothetical protein
MNTNRKFRVIIKEVGNKEFEQYAYASTIKAVVDFYGLNEPDIEYYKIYDITNEE